MMTEAISSDSQNQSELINALKNWLIWLDKGDDLLKELKNVRKSNICPSDKNYLEKIIAELTIAITILEESDDTLITEYHEHLKKLLKLEV